MKTQAQEIASYIQEEYEKEINSRESADISQNKKESPDIHQNKSISIDIPQNKKESVDSTKSVLTIRINNLQFRSTSQSSGEFIKWSVNPLCNNLLSYLDNGWEDHGDIITKGHVSMSKSLFSLPETCITIGYLEADKNSNCCDLSSVGPRILELSLSERNDFFEVYTLAETKLLALANEPEN